MKILLLEDNVNDAIIIQKTLNREFENIEVLRIDSRQKFEIELGNNYDIILSDFSMPEFNGLEALKIRNLIAPLMPFIIVTGTVNEMTAVDCLKAGADNYILKDQLNRLPTAIERAIQEKFNEREKKITEEKLHEVINRYDALVEHSDIGILIESIKGEFIFYNDRFQTIFGNISESNSNITINDIFIITESNRKLFEKGNLIEAKDFEIQGKTLKGELLWLNIHKEKYYINGENEGYQYFIKDITAQRKNTVVVDAINRLARKALVGSSLKEFLNYSYGVIKEFIDAKNFFVALYDSESKSYSFPFYTDEKDSLDEYSGYNLIGSLTDHVRVIREPLLITADSMIQLKEDGDIKDYGTDCKVWLGVPLMNDNEVIGVICLQDYNNENALGNNESNFLERFAPWVSMKINQEKVISELAEREKRFYDLFSSSPNAIIVHQDGIIQMANSSALKLAGYKKSSEMVGESIYKFVDDSMFEKVKQRSVAAHKGVTQPPIIEKLLTANGRNIFVEVTAIPFEYKGKPASQVIMKDVTSEYDAKKLLNESEEKFRVSFKTSLDAITITDIQTGEYVEVNDAFLEYTGYRLDEVIGKNSYALNVWYDIKDRDYLIKEIKEKGFITNFQTKFIMKSGKVEHALVSSRLITFDNKEFLILMTRLITDLVEASEQIEINEQKFNEIFNSASDTIILYKLNGNLIIHDCNKAFTQLYGYEKDQVIGKPVDLIIKNEFKSNIKSNIEKLAFGKTLIFESIHVKNDGTIFPVEVSSKRIIIGNTEFILSIERDISKRKIAENLIKDSEEKFRLGFSTIPDALVIINIKTRKPIEINNSFESLTGYNFDNWPDSDSLIPPFSNIEDFVLICQRAENEDVRNFEMEIDSSNNSVRNVLLSAVKMQLHDADHIMFIMKDITEIKEIQNQLRNAIHQAEESDKLKSAFLANMSHEIRTPMNHIIGFTEFIKQGVSEEELQSYIDIIQRSSNHLLALINDIIDISKIEAGEIKLNIVEINPSIVLKELADSFVYDKRLTINPAVQLINHSKFSMTHRIQADRVRLTQVLINLLTNAIKFTKEGSIEFGYESTDDGFVKFYVKDSGSGIDSKYFKLIFERFRQAENKGRLQNEGTGLGLALSKAYIEMMGGTIWVESELDKGSTFYFTVPLSKPIIEPLPNLNLSFEDFNIGLMLKDKTDEFLFKTFLKGVCPENQIIKYNFGLEIDKASFDKTKLIFISISDNVTDSIQIFNKIKETNQDINFIGVVDYQRHVIDSNLGDYGFFGFVDKPLNKTKIANIIAKFIIE